MSVTAIGCSKLTKKTSMAKIMKTALYYPEIAIPSGRWLRQAILYFDQVSSIVPYNLDAMNRQIRASLEQQGVDVPAEFESLTEDLRTLEAAQQYRPIRPEFFFAQPESIEARRFCDEFLGALASSRFQQTLGKKAGWLFDCELFGSKGPEELFRLLVEEGFAKQKDDGPWLYFERSTGHLYMSLLAKYLAAFDGENDTVPSTTQKESHFRDIAYRIGETVEGVCIGEVLFDKVLPCPDDTAEIDDILKFKEQRQDELCGFRVELAEVEKDLSAATTKQEIVHIVQQFVDRRDSALAKLQSSFDDDKIGCFLQSMRALVSIGSPTLWLTAAAILGSNTSLVNQPVNVVAAGVAMVGAVQVSVTCASHVLERRQELRESAFSYIYHLKKKSKRHKIRR
jgi:Family of unknown function (DUF6236)